MQLSLLSIKTKLDGNYFYFAADNIYFDLYGKALVLSLLDRAPWAKIHIHFFNQTTSQQLWCNNKNITYTNETVDSSHTEFKTLCACIRFVRIPEIFKDTARIMAFDCDVIVNNDIPNQKFLKDTLVSKVIIRKENRSLASAVSFGNDSARHILRKKILLNFEADNIYWFLDQDVMDEMYKEGSLSALDKDWSNSKMKQSAMIWNAKGERKFKIKYQQLIDIYIKKANQ